MISAHAVFVFLDIILFVAVPALFFGQSLEAAFCFADLLSEGKVDPKAGFWHVCP